MTWQVTSRGYAELEHASWILHKHLEFNLLVDSTAKPGRKIDSLEHSRRTPVKDNLVNYLAFH